MLEIICIIWLWKTNGKNALMKGQKPTKYHVLTLALWFGLEILGTFTGAIIMEMVSPGTDPFIGAYLFGIVGAALGGFSSYQIAKNAPQGDYRQNPYQQQGYGQNPWDQEWNQGQNNWNQNQNNWSQGQNNWNQDQNGWNQGQNNWNQNQNNWNQNQNSWNQNPDQLQYPATVRIFEEQGGYEGAQDAFFLNGHPICSLRPGTEFTFTTSVIHNTITIGRPIQQEDDREHTVRFIAAENGFVEIHARAGKLLPERFANYVSR